MNPWLESKILILSVFYKSGNLRKTYSTHKNQFVIQAAAFLNTFNIESKKFNKNGLKKWVLTTFHEYEIYSS